MSPQEDIIGEKYKPKEISAKLHQVEVMSGQGAAMADVSRSSVENDHAVAEAGVKVVGVSDLSAHPWRT